MSVLSILIKFVTFMLVCGVVVVMLWCVERNDDINRK